MLPIFPCKPLFLEAPLLKYIVSSPAVDSPRVVLFSMLSVIHCGCSFYCLFYPPNPHESPRYPDPLYKPPLPTFLSSPAPFLCLSPPPPPQSLLAQTLLFQPTAIKQCLHSSAPGNTHTCTHRSTDVLTPTQTHSVGFPRVKHRSASSSCSPPMRKTICPLSPRVSHPAWRPSRQPVTQCAVFQVHQILRPSAPRLAASGSAGNWTDLKLTLSSRWLAD